MSTTNDKKPMRTKAKSEAELTALFSEAAQPRAAFVSDLKNQVLSYAQKKQPQYNFLSIWVMKFSQSVVKVGIAGLAVVAGVSVFGYEYWNGTRLYPNQEEIFAKISERQQQSNSGPKDSSTLTAASDQTEKMALYLPVEDRDYTYRTLTTSYTRGASADKCPTVFGFDKNVATEESAEYYTSKSEPFASYYKYVTYTKEGKIFDYILTRKQEQWVYRGGSYAVHLINMPDIRPLASQEGGGENIALSRETAESEKTAPVSTTEKTTVPVNTYFGENAKILGTETRNGRKLYKIQWSYQVSCEQVDYDKVLRAEPNSVISSPEMDDKVVVIAYADVETYALVEENQYLQSVSGANLLYQTVRDETKKMIGETDEVKQQFTFDQAVTVKTVDASNEAYEKGYRSALVSYLKQRGGNVILLKSATLNAANSVDVTYVPDSNKHLIDRAFYPTGSIGDSLWEDNKDLFAAYKDSNMTYPSLTLSYSIGSDGSTWVSMNEDVGNISDSAAVATFGAALDQLKKVGTINLTVSGQEVTGTVFERILDKQSGGTEPGSTGSSSGAEDTSTAGETRLTDIPETQEPLYREVVVIFRSNGVTTTVMTNLESKKPITALESMLQFSAVPTSNTSELEKQLKTAPVSLVMY